MSNSRLPWWRNSRGEWWVVGQGVLLAALMFAPSRWPWSTPWDGLAVRLGAVLLVVGLGLAARAIRDLGDNLTPFPKPRRHGVLVQRGIYARARHPIYGGLIVAAIGWALWKTSALHLVLAGALAAYITAKSRVEERYLESRFPEYAGYRARTRRLLPWIL